MKEINTTPDFYKQPESRPATKVLGEPAVYEFKVVQSLSDQWADWFNDLDVWRDEQGHTLLSGTILDQAALHGVLTKIRDLNLTLLYVIRK